MYNTQNSSNKELKQNIIGSLTLSFLVSIIIGLLAYFTTIIFFRISPDPIKLILIIIIAGVISGIILTFITISIIYIVFRRGYDPDNITGPALATFGDIVTIVCIYCSSIMVEVIM